MAILVDARTRIRVSLEQVDLDTLKLLEMFKTVAARVDKREFPNVTAEQISGGGDLKSTLEKLLTLVSADQPLDIVGVQHSVLGQYVNLGILKDLTANSRRDPAM